MPTSRVKIDREHYEKILTSRAKPCTLELQNALFYPVQSPLEVTGILPVTESGLKLAIQYRLSGTHPPGDWDKKFYMIPYEVVLIYFGARRSRSWLLEPSRSRA